jgi:acetyl-CoA carboxylase biotin carboxyl carrier protein
MAKDLKGKGSPEQTLVRELAALLDETGLGEIEIEREGVRVRVARRMAVEAAIGMPAQAAIQHGTAQPAEAPKKAATTGQASGRGEVADGGNGLSGAGAGRGPVHRGRIARRPGPDDLIIEGHEDHEPHPCQQGRHGHRHSRHQTASPVEFGEPLAIIE